MINSETGKLITADGRSIVADDPDGKEFPWTPESFLEIVKKGDLLADKEGKKTTWDEVEGEIVGVYFSAHWVRQQQEQQQQQQEQIVLLSVLIVNLI